MLCVSNYMLCKKTHKQKEAMACEDKVMEIFCIGDDFCKKVASECDRNLILEDNAHCHRNHKGLWSFVKNICAALTVRSFFGDKTETLPTHTEKSTRMTHFGKTFHQPHI